MGTDGTGDISNIMVDTGSFSIPPYAPYETVNSAQYICDRGLQLKVLIDVVRPYSLNNRTSF